MGETAHNMHRRSAIQSLVFCYRTTNGLWWWGGSAAWEGGREEMGRYGIAWGVIVEAVMWWFV